MTKDLKSLSLTSNVKLAQSGRHESVHTRCVLGPRTQGLIPIEGNIFTEIIADSFRVSLFIDLGFPQHLGIGWWGSLGTFMISRPF